MNLTVPATEIEIAKTLDIINQAGQNSFLTQTFRKLVFERDRYKMEAKFTGIGPDGQPQIFTVPDTQMYYNECPDCGNSNGGGFIISEHSIRDELNDPYSPTNVPCIWCGKGPMKLIMVNRK